VRLSIIQPDIKFELKEKVAMQKNTHWLVKIGTPKNRKALFIILTMIGMAIAGGAPGASSGIGGGLSTNFPFLGF
jgi:hypothetical protein